LKQRLHLTPPELSGAVAGRPNLRRTGACNPASFFLSWNDLTQSTQRAIDAAAGFLSHKRQEITFQRTPIYLLSYRFIIQAWGFWKPSYFTLPSIIEILFSSETARIFPVHPKTCRIRPGSATKAPFRESAVLAVFR